MSRIAITFLPLFFVLIFQSLTWAYTLTGKVLIKDTTVPIKNATVTISGRSVKTNRSGVFTIANVDGKQELSIRNDQ